MSSLTLRAAAAAVAVMGAFLLGGLSQLPVPGSDPDLVILRLTWRLRSQESGDCLRPTPAELERVPPHMRNPDACVGPLPPYELRVWVDEELVIEELVSGRGARGDRPLYVFEDLPLAPGAHDVRVDFERQQGASAGVQDLGSRLSLDAGVVLEPGTVTLVARAGDTGDLEVRRPR